jgi:methylmalonyl-CoA/ethylmalonyl-CoA epimerase
VKVKRINHISIAVPTLDDGRTALSILGFEAGPEEHVENQLTTTCFLQTEEGDTAIELIAPAGNPSLDRFLARRGPGMHHICLEVDNLSATLAELKTAGVELIDQAPREGAHGHLVAFIHPRATGGVLFELCQCA